MADLFVVFATAACFAVAYGAVRLCDRVIGPEPDPAAGAETGADPSALRAGPRGEHDASAAVADAVGSR